MGGNVVVPAWIESLNDALNGFVVAALFLAATTEMGLLYQGSNPARPQFRSFSLACHAAPDVILGLLQREKSAA
jgi:hypothetical protein